MQLLIHNQSTDDRVVKRFGSIPESKSTDPNHIGSFAAKDGTGAKGKMGEGSERIGANTTSKENGSGPCEAHHVSSSPEEDRSVSKSQMGEVEGRKEGCLEASLVGSLRSFHSRSPLPYRNPSKGSPIGRWGKGTRIPISLRVSWRDEGMAFNTFRRDQREFDWGTC